MAELLYSNYTDKGASFVANTVVANGGAQVTVQGDIDWVNHQGTASVSSTSSDATLTGVIWAENVVLERRPTLDQILVGMGLAPDPLIARAPNMNSRLDQLIGVIVGLAAEQRDNAQLILQKEGSAFLRDDVLRGRDVKVVRYGTRNIYWIDSETGRMLRLEATSEGAGLPVVVDILERKPVKVTSPDPARVVAATDISEIYASLGQL